MAFAFIIALLSLASACAVLQVRSTAEKVSWVAITFVLIAVAVVTSQASGAGS